MKYLIFFLLISGCGIGQDTSLTSAGAYEPEYCYYENDSEMFKKGIKVRVDRVHKLGHWHTIIDTVDAGEQECSPEK